MAVILGHALDRSHYDYEHSFRPVDAPVHPLSIQLLAYWRDCEAQGGMRMGRDLPARAIAQILPHLIVAEPVGDWEDARIRLAGFGMATHFGRDVSGALMSEVYAGPQSGMHLLLAGSRSVIARNQPGAVEHLVLDKEREVLRQEMICLPLIAPDGDARWVLVGTFNY
jgi:hypothetical protein